MSIKHFIIFFLCCCFSYAECNSEVFCAKNAGNYLEKFSIRLKDVEGQVFVFSNPKTGTNLTLSILNQLTSKITLWARAPWKGGRLMNRSLAEIDYDLFPILGSHVPRTPADPKKNKLIITLRDYKEFYSRTVKKNPDKKFSCASFYKYLKYFERWPEENRFLVRYEDLIGHPLDVIEKIGSFLNISEEKIFEVQSNYDLICATCRDNYFARIRTVDELKDLRFHQRNVPQKKLLEIENRLKKINPKLFDRYLKVYELETDV